MKNCSCLSARFLSSPTFLYHDHQTPDTITAKTDHHDHRVRRDDPADDHVSVTVVVVSLAAVGSSVAYRGPSGSSSVTTGGVGLVVFVVGVDVRGFVVGRFVGSAVGSRVGEGVRGDVTRIEGCGVGSDVGLRVSQPPDSGSDP